MTSPYKQISFRRLPPFPGSRSRRGFREDDFLSPSPGPDSGISLDEVDMDSMKMFLSCHPDMLEDIVLETVGLSQMTTWIQKKKQSSGIDDTVSIKQPLIQEKYTNTDMVKLQCELLKELNANEDILPHLAQLMNIMGISMHSDSMSMYVVRSGGKELRLYVPDSDNDSKYHLGMTTPISHNTTVAAHVACTKQSVLVKELHLDNRFPNGIGVEDSLLHSILCVPFTLPTNDILCVMEFGRSWQHPVFNDQELQLATAIIGWSGLAQHQQKIAYQLQKQSELNDFLLEISKMMFNDIVDMDILIEKIMLYAKELVQADRSALFLVDEQSSELYANLFDEGIIENGKPVFSRKSTLRFSMDKGIAGLVARTGEIVNIKNAYSDPRFNREIDRQTGYTTYNILCMPIISRGSVIGIIQMINKKAEHDGEALSGNNGFSQIDESAFKMFAVYCALALHYSKVYTDLQYKTAEATVFDGIKNYHIQCTTPELRPLMHTFHPREVPVDIDSFYFYGPGSHEDHLLQLYVHMLDDLFGQDRFDKTKLCNFLTTIKKNYRSMPYHNWKHGWNVSHCMYCVLSRLKGTGLISDLRMQALMFASFSHDIDHRGYNNMFYNRYKEPMAVLYPTSTMEYHHYHTTVTILQREENNIFSGLSRDDYQLVLEYMKHCILATDLTMYFANQKQLAGLVLSQSLDLINPAHLDDVVALIVTSCDLCAVSKCWEDHLSTIHEIYDEFYHQGDEEKSKGEIPMAMMDRDNRKHIPQDQIGFFKFVCVPCYQTLAEILPEASDLLAGCQDNLQQWQRVIEGKSTKVWEPAKSIPTKK